jgi:hypothetical protein
MAMGRVFGIAVFSIFWGLALANPPLTVPIRDEGFTASSLRTKSSFSLLDPSRFGMQQSYSMQYTSTSFGSFSSGVYLNTLSYRFGIPLTLSVDIGAYNMFHNDFEASAYDAQDANSRAPQFILPRIGLEYRPTSNVTMSLQVLQFPDAYQAYGPWGYYGYNGWSRFSKTED